MDEDEVKLAAQRLLSLIAGKHDADPRLVVAGSRLATAIGIGGHIGLDPIAAIDHRLKEEISTIRTIRAPA